MDINSLTPEYFQWVVTHMADMVIRLAKEPPRAAPKRWHQFLGGRVAR
jgi:hypothetical protein